jgi:hypothetical protein
MTSNEADRLICRWGDQFRRYPLAAGVVVGLGDRGDEIWRHAFELLQRESPEYRNSVDAKFTAESKAHCNELLRTIVAVAARQVQNSDADPFDFVRTHARWRARHRVPLIASLHAYRLAHRTYWELTRQALPLTMLSDFWIEFFDHVGSVLSEAHAIEEGMIVAQSTITYVALIDDLLRGQEPRDAEARRLCALCGIRSGVPMAVLIACPQHAEGGKQIEIEATMRSFVRLVEQVLPPATFGKLVHLQDNEVTVLACSQIDTGRSLMQALRGTGLTRRNGAGHAVRVGISLDAVQISGLPAAMEEARLSLEFASAAQPLMHFSDIDLREFLVRRADRAAVRLIPEWARQLSLTGDGQWCALYRTIHAFADCNFNVKQTAQRLCIHTNTVYFRLNRINQLTGVNPRTYAGTSHLLTALRLLEIHHGKDQVS